MHHTSGKIEYIMSSQTQTGKFGVGFHLYVFRCEYVAMQVDQVCRSVGRSVRSHVGTEVPTHW